MQEKRFEVPVIFQDEYLVVVDKPVDLPVHKNDFMPHDAPYLTKLIGEITGKWIYNVHRLDSKTSGIIVLAFSSEAANKLTVQFENKQTRKTYYAVVQGNPGEGMFDQKVSVMKKSKFKKPALTHYKTIQTVHTGIVHKDKENVELSLVEIIPETGRWHQIRQHFAKNRFDIIGDVEHGDFTLNKILMEKAGVKRLMLHAGELELTHPVTNERLTFKAKMPDEFENLLTYFRG